MYEGCVLLSMRFPQKLWKIVNECDSNAIQWNINGTSILLNYIKFHDEFLNSNCCSIFKTNNITSFVRQLNLYGFRKITWNNRDSFCNSRNLDVHEYSHENFRMGRPDLLNQVCRKITSSDASIYHQHKQELMNPGSPRLTSLQICQLSLTRALEHAAREYHDSRKF